MELFPNFEYEPKPETELGVEKGNTLPAVDEDTMSELVALAVQIRDLEPWLTVSEDDLMGVRDPETEELQLVSILGGAGEVFSLQCHIPPEGLTFWQDIFQSFSPQVKPGLTNLRLLECEFVERSEAEPEDLRIHKRFAGASRKNKLICRFRNYEPDYFPWFFEEEDARHMIHVLRLFFRFYEEILPEKDMHFRAPAGKEALPEIPVFTLKKGGKAENPTDWKIKREPIPSESVIVEPPRPEAELLPDMEGFPMEEETWEVASFFMPDPVSDGGRPYFAKTALCLRIAENKIPFPAAPVIYGGEQKTDTEALRELLSKAIKNAGYLPSKIRIASETARCAFLLASEKYNFELSFETQEELPAIAAEMMKAADQNALDDLDDEFDFGNLQDNGVLNQLVESLPADIITKLGTAETNEALELLSSHMIQMERDGTLRELLSEPDNIIHADFSQSHSRAALPKPTGKEHFRLRIELAGITPPVWREITIPVDASFYHLHQAIQDVFAWEGEHLYGFSIGSGKKAVSVGADDEVSETALLIDQIGRRRKKFSYTYDYGDDWLHNIEVKGIEKLEKPDPNPHCLGGAEIAPPDDCGGIEGYDLLRSGDHPWNDEESGDYWKEYFTGRFDPEDVEFADATINYEHGQLTYFE